MEYYIGTTGWSYGFWKGSFYPKGVSDQLSFYSTQSSVVEINSTYYQIPSFQMIEKWDRSPVSDFHFFAKMNREVTHSDDPLSKRIERLVEFMTAMQRFEKLHGLLFQFPFSFKATADHARQLEKLLSTAQDMVDCLLFLEFRHKSWITQAKDFTSTSNSVFIAQSTKMHIPSKIVDDQRLQYYRILGSRKEMPDHLLGIKRLNKEKELSMLADSLCNLKGETAFVFVNNRFSGNGSKDAQALHRLIQKRGFFVDGFKPRSTLDDFL